ncbi:hypothetical protein BHO_0029500 (plasmid) [Borrelia hermsii YBT]|nr:hypothetical protein BHO_0029500 [Borrelia hermsii YBT]
MDMKSNKSKVLLVLLLVSCNVDKKGTVSSSVDGYHNASFPTNRAFVSVGNHNNVRFDELFVKLNLTDYQARAVLCLKNVLTDSRFVVRDADGVRVKSYDDDDFYKLLSITFGAVRTQTVAENIAVIFNAKASAEAAVAKVQDVTKKDALSKRFVSANNYYEKVLKLACDDPNQAYDNLTNDSNFAKLIVDAKVKFEAIDIDVALISKIDDKFNLTDEETRVIYYLRDVVVNSEFIMFCNVRECFKKPRHKEDHKHLSRFEIYTVNNFHYVMSRFVFNTDKFRMVIQNIMNILEARAEARAAINIINDRAEKDKLNDDYLKVDNDYTQALKAAFYNPAEENVELCNKLIALSYADKFKQIKAKAHAIN